MTQQRALQALGRPKVGQMNKAEAAYAATLAQRQHAGEAAWFKFEGLKFRLADNTFYTPDFAVMLSDGALEAHEVKGHWQEDARAKIRSPPTCTRSGSWRSGRGRRRTAAAGLRRSSKTRSKPRPDLRGFVVARYRATFRRRRAAAPIAPSAPTAKRARLAGSGTCVASK